MRTGLTFGNALFLTVGVLFLSFGVYSGTSNWRLMQTGIQTHGRVIRVEPHKSRRSSGTVYVPVVEFLVHNEQEITFTSDSGSNPPAFTVDEEVDVLYDPENPHNAHILTFMQFWGATVILLGIGTTFAGIGGGTLLSWAHGRGRAHWLKKNGRCISTKLDYVEIRTNITVNGDHPYRIISRWLDPATNREYVFRSFDLYHDPKPLIDKHPDRSIDVLIDPDNPKRYWLDTDFLGDLAD